jgi:hypothetical protein
MEMSKDRVRRYVGQWVHCHSMYGLHEGILHRALHDGVIIIHHTSLARGQETIEGDVQTGEFRPSVNDPDMSQVQFFLPAPGLFVPYGGLYGLWPRPGFVI